MHAAFVFEDVKYVVNDQELNAYRSLRTPEEYRAFFHAFWTRRDPTPARAHNVRLAEHYRRLRQAEQDLDLTSTNISHASAALRWPSILTTKGQSYRTVRSQGNRRRPRRLAASHARKTVRSLLARSRPTSVISKRQRGLPD